jgi:hypothetical protein
VFLGLLILAQTVQRMISLKEETPMENFTHQLKQFVFTSLEYSFAALVNIACGAFSPLSSANGLLVVRVFYPITNPISNWIGLF